MTERLFMFSNIKRNSKWRNKHDVPLWESGAMGNLGDYFLVTAQHGGTSYTENLFERCTRPCSAPSHYVIKSGVNPYKLLLTFCTLFECSVFPFSFLLCLSTENKTAN